VRSPEFWNYYETVRLALEWRSQSFTQMFDYLDRFDRPVGIIETGCVREVGNWRGDGGSTLLFDKYAQTHPGSVVQSVDIDAKATFNWVRDALLLPMKPSSHVVVISSSAAILGSPLSGSYAGAKRMQWLITEYASQEAARLKLNLRFHCLLPTLNPNTDLGRVTMAAYAQRAGVSTEEFAKRFCPPLTPAIIGQAVVDLHKNPSQWDQLAYRVSGHGLLPLNQANEAKAAPAGDPKAGKTVAAD